MFTLVIRLMSSNLPVGEVVCDELVVVVVDRLAEDPSLAEADRVLGARLDDRVDNRLHLVLRSVF